MKMNTEQEARIKASKLSENSLEPIFVIEMDEEGFRGFYITRNESYLNSDEFAAFNGIVIDEYRDGIAC